MEPLWQGIAVASVLLVVNGLVLSHAVNLYDLSPLERQIHTPMGPASWPVSWTHLWDNLERAATTWFFEMIVGIAAIPFFLIGARYAWKRRVKFSFSKGYWYSWLISFIIFSIFFVTRYKDHDYYLTALLPVAALISATGVLVLCRYSTFRGWASVVLIVCSIAGYERVHDRWFKHQQLPKTILQHSAEISHIIPKQDLVLVQGDTTPNAYLYYIGRKGFSLQTRYHQDLCKLPLNNFKWLLHYRPRMAIEEQVQQHFNLEKIRSIGEFDVYRLKVKPCKSLHTSI